MVRYKFAKNSKKFLVANNFQIAFRFMDFAILSPALTVYYVFVPTTNTVTAK